MSSPQVEPAVTFIIPVLNDAARLARCLGSIAANGPCGIDVVVVDNGSTDGSDRVAVEAGATLLHRPGASVAALRNAGAEVARGEIFAFVDADHELPPGWAAAARLALDDPHTAVVGGPYVGDGRTWVQREYGGLRPRPAVRRTVPWLGAGNMAIRRSAFLKVGGFDERLETCEDVDLCRRLRASGLAIIVDPLMLNVHLGEPATLRDVFLGELWRGRDNLRVSFGGPLDARNVASALMPAATLVMLLVSVGACALGAFRWSAVAAGVAAVPVLLRLVLLCANRQDWRPLALERAFSVALFFEAGRALALVARAGHRSRRAGDRRGVEGPQP